MADKTLTDKQGSFADDLRAAHAPIYHIIALLHGAEALLEKAETQPDPDGDIWHAAELVRHTINEAEAMMTGFEERRLIDRAGRVEEMTA